MRRSSALPNARPVSLPSRRSTGQRTRSASACQARSSTRASRTSLTARQQGGGRSLPLLLCGKAMGPSEFESATASRAATLAQPRIVLSARSPAYKTVESRRHGEFAPPPACKAIKPSQSPDEATIVEPAKEGKDRIVVRPSCECPWVRVSRDQSEQACLRHASGYPSQPPLSA